LARLLAGRGLRVVLAARRADRLEELAAELGADGCEVQVIPADLAKPAERLRLFDAASAQAPVDVLINNAGFGWYGWYHRMPWRTAQQMLAVNMESVAHMTSLCLPGMLERKFGRVVNIGSIAGGLPNQGIAMYAGSKAFLDAFTTALHRELRGSGVHASVMRLGPVKTEFFDQARQMENGGPVPAERLAVDVETVSRALWRLLQHPRRVVYVPFWLGVVPFVEPLLGNLIDLLGPLLLKRNNRS
jgi:short-subunit dehydrogenase